MGCRYYFVVDRLEDLVDEGGSRSASRVHEHDSSQLVSEQNVAILKFWSRCQPRSTSNALIVCTQRVSPFHRDLVHLLNWSSCFHERNVFETLCVSKQRVSPFYRDLHLLLNWSSCFHEKHVDSWERSALSEQTTGLSVLWEARSRPGCRGPQRKYAEYLSTTLRKFKV